MKHRLLLICMHKKKGGFTPHANYIPKIGDDEIHLGFILTLTLTRNPYFIDGFCAYTIEAIDEV